MRTLAIDLGSKRIGLAMSDEGGKYATPLDVLTVSDPVRAIEPILKIIRDEAVERVVLGLPLNMDDSIGPAAKSVLKWSKLLETACGFRVTFVDERLSSFTAEQSLNERKRGGEKMTRRDKKERLDALAAAGFLREFLDGRLPAIEID